MSAQAPSPSRRKRLAIVGGCLGGLFVLLVALVYQHRRTAEEAAYPTSDAGADAFADDPIEPPRSTHPPYTREASKGGGEVFFTSEFTRMVGVNGDEQTVLVLRDHTPNAPVLEYFVVHLDGRVDNGFVLSSRGDELATDDPGCMNTAQSRATLAPLEEAAKRFRLFDEWLPFLVFGQSSDFPPWRARFGEDGSSEVHKAGASYSWIRPPGSPDFVLHPGDPKAPGGDEDLPVISYESDDRRTAHLSEGTSDICFFWQARGEKRRKLACILGGSHPDVRCEHGICALFEGITFITLRLVDQRTGQLLAHGSLHGAYARAFRADDEGHIAISYYGGPGETIFISSRSGHVRYREGTDLDEPMTMWLDDRTIIQEEPTKSLKRSLVRLRLDVDNDWQTSSASVELQKEVDGGARR